MSRSQPKLPAWLRISIRVRKRARQRVKCGIFPTLEKPSNRAGAYPRVRRPFLRTEPDFDTISGRPVEKSNPCTNQDDRELEPRVSGSRFASRSLHEACISLWQRRPFKPAPRTSASSPSL